MDPLLRQLQSLSIGVSVNNMYAGGYLHADDIRTLANNLSSLDSQISIVTRFAADNFLILNASKCEIVAVQRSGTTPHGSVDGDVTSFPIRDEAKCLGYLWKVNLSSVSMIQERIQSARKAIW